MGLEQERQEMGLEQEAEDGVEAGGRRWAGTGGVLATVLVSGNLLCLLVILTSSISWSLWLSSRLRQLSSPLTSTVTSLQTQGDTHRYSWEPLKLPPSPNMALDDDKLADNAGQTID